jgi:hypothetical protein
MTGADSPLTPFFWRLNAGSLRGVGVVGLVGHQTLPPLRGGRFGDNRQHTVPLWEEGEKKEIRKTSEEMKAPLSFEAAT